MIREYDSQLYDCTRVLIFPFSPLRNCSVGVVELNDTPIIGVAMHAWSLRKLIIILSTSIILERYFSVLERCFSVLVFA